MTTRLSQFNNTTLPLGMAQTFVGAWERTLTGLEATVFINCSGLCLLTIEQSVDASNVRIPTTFNYVPTTDVSTFSVSIALPFFRVRLYNGDVGAQAYLSLNTYIINTPPIQVNVDTGDIIVSGTVAVSSVAGVVDVSGNVVSTLATSAAQLRQMPLVVGHWYQVASVGDTIGAVWAEIGAIWDGEGLPPVGRQFQCLYAGYGTGTCYDITAPVDATATTLPTLSYDQSAVGSLVAPQQLIGCKLMGVASTVTHEEKWCNDGGAIPIFGTVGIDSGNNTIKIDPENNVVVISDGNLPLAIDVWNGRFGYPNIPVNIDPSNNVVQLDPASSLPAGTNSLGSVTIFNSSVINTYTYADISGAWVGSAVDLRSYSLADFYMLAAGSVTLAGLDTAMNFLIQYSPNSAVWFNSGQSISLTAAITQGTAVGILTASPYVRLIADPANDAGDVATDVTLWTPAKAI